MAANAAASQPQVSEEQKKKEELLLSKANAIRAVWQSLAKAFTLPPPAPPRNKCHWDFVLQEAGWLAHDVMQERLWKQAAAYQLAYAAAVFDRKRLRPCQTKVLEYVATDRVGKVVSGKADKHDARSQRGGANKQHQAAANNHTAGVAAVDDPPDPPSGPELPWPCLLVSPHFPQVLAAQLEEADVARLSRHSEAQARYQSLLEEARRAAPPTLSPEEDELLLGKRKARKPKAVGLDDELGGDMSASPMPGARARPRPGVGPGAGMQGRGGVELSDVDSMLGGPRDKRKRKNRDYGDEDYEPPSKQQSRDRMVGAARPPLGPSGLRQDSRTDMQQGMGPGMDARKGAGMARAGSLKTPPGKGQLQRQDSMARMANMQNRGMMVPRQGNAWTQADDQLLAAFVTEFAQNWYLIADVLRAASSMQGISRRPEACKQRYMQLIRTQQQVPETEELRPEQMQQPLLTKPHAKDLLQNALPVTEQVLQVHRAILAEVVGKLQQRRAMERQGARDVHKFRQAEHPSHVAVNQKMLAATGGHYLTPVQIGVVADPNAQSALLQGQQQQGGLPPGAGGMGRGLPGQALGHLSRDTQLSDAAAAQAAAQANAAAQAAAAAAVAQQQQQGGPQPPGQPGGGGGGTLKLPPGMTREQLIQMAQSSSLPQLQQQARATAAAAQQNPTPQNQAAAQTAAAVFAAAQQIHARQMQQQQAMANGQQPGAGGGPTGSTGAPPNASSRGQQIVRPEQIQHLIANNRIPASVGQTLLSVAQKGNLTMQQVQQVLQQVKQQAAAAAAAQQQAASGGAAGSQGPNMSAVGGMQQLPSSNSAGVPPGGGAPMQPMGMPGQLGGWPNQANQPGMYPPPMQAQSMPGRPASQQ